MEVEASILTNDKTEVKMDPMMAIALRPRSELDCEDKIDENTSYPSFFHEKM